MSKPIKYAVFLILLGVLAGLLLAFVNGITSEIISSRERQKIKEALQEYFDYAEYSENISTQYPDLNKAIQEIYLGYDSTGKVTGVIYKTSAMGYGGQVVALIAITIDGTIDKIVIVDISTETPGIGDRVKGYDFNVIGESVANYSPQVIAGVTYTANAVVIGINASVTHFKANQSSLGGVS